MTSIEIPQHLTTAIDTYAAARGLDRATAIERLLTQGLEVSDQSTAPQDLTSHIHSAYASLASRPGAWVSLAKLRAALPGINHAALATRIYELHLSGDVTLIPEENRRSITPADRDAAVTVGREPRHLISISR